MTQEDDGKGGVMTATAASCSSMIHPGAIDMQKGAEGMQMLQVLSTGMRGEREGRG